MKRKGLSYSEGEIGDGVMKILGRRKGLGLTGLLERGFGMNGLEIWEGSGFGEGISGGGIDEFGGVVRGFIMVEGLEIWRKQKDL